MLIIFAGDEGRTLVVSKEKRIKAEEFLMRKISFRGMLKFWFDVVVVMNEEEWSSYEVYKDWWEIMMITHCEELCLNIWKWQSIILQAISSISFAIHEWTPPPQRRITTIHQVGGWIRYYIIYPLVNLLIIFIRVLSTGGESMTVPGDRLSRWVEKNISSEYFNIQINTILIAM